MKRAPVSEKMKRLIILTTRLAQGISFSSDEICAEFGISERTFFRDIAILRLVMKVECVG